MGFSSRITAVLSCLALSGVLMAGAAQARTYKIAHAFAATHPFTASLEKFASDVDAATEGRIKFGVVHSGLLGSEMEMISQVMAGSLDSAVLGRVSIFQSFTPKAAVTDLPFLFPDAETAFAAMDGRMGELLAEQIINPLGIEVLGYMENGFRHFTNSKQPIVKPEDMKEIKFRSASFPLRRKMFEALGVAAVPVAFPEVSAALRQGTVDGQENLLATVESSKLNEVQTYLSLSAHIFEAAPIVINQELWNSFSAKDQALIQKAMHDAKIHQREACVKRNEDLINRFQADGMEVNAIDRKLFVKAVQPVWDTFIKENGRELIDAALGGKE